MLLLLLESNIDCIWLEFLSDPSFVVYPCIKFLTKLSCWSLRTLLLKIIVFGLLWNLRDGTTRATVGRNVRFAVRVLARRAFPELVTVLPRFSRLPLWSIQMTLFLNSFICFVIFLSGATRPYAWGASGRRWTHWTHLACSGEDTACPAVRVNNSLATP